MQATDVISKKYPEPIVPLNPPSKITIEYPGSELLKKKKTPEVSTASLHR